MKRTFFAVCAFLLFGLGCAGAAVPLLPSTPFFLGAAFCFTKSSKRLDAWFKNTNMYKKHLRTFSEKKAMTVRAKVTVLSTITILLGTGFLLMKSTAAGRIAVTAVWLFHILYFTLCVKTLRISDSD